MRRKILWTLTGICLVPLIVPYFIPLSTTHEIPNFPYPDSAFFMTSDQVNIHYRLNSPKAIKGKILLVHGLASSTFSFKKNVNALVSAGYQVLTIDLPSFGYSDRKRGLIHSQVNRAKWLWELIDKIDKDTKDDRPWNLLGHSMGASTILAMSNQASHRVVSLIMIDAAVTQNNLSLPFTFDTPIGQWLKVYLRYGAIRKANFEKLLTSAFAQPVDDESVEGYLKPLLVDKTASSLVDFIKTAKNVNVKDWKFSKTPLLVTWGEKDTWIKPVAIKEIRKIAQDIQVVIFPNQGHCPHETDEGYNQVLISFLDSRND